MSDIGMIVVAGCGRMGFGMVRALADAGFDAWGHDVRPTADFGGFASRMVDAARMRDAQIVISVVRDQEETETLLFGPQNAAGGAALKTLVISSTLSPRYVRALRNRVPAHVALVDAPMSGAQISADERRLSFMLGGEAAELDRLQPLFDAMGTKIHRMGEFGAGMTGKVLNNYVAGSAAAAVRQAIDWAAAAGIDRDRLLAMMHDSSGQTWFGSKFYDIEFSRNGYAPDNTVHILQKDVAAALDGAGASEDALGLAAIAKMRGWRDIG